MPALPYPTLADQQGYWDRRWGETNTPNAWSRRRSEAILTFLRSHALDHPKLLDLGCGTGWFTEQLAHFGPATGIDLSERAIAIARSQFPNVTFLAGNLFELPLPADHFDVVVSQEVIAHVDDQLGYLARAAHVLKPRGYLIVTTANKFVIERLDWPPQPPGHIEQWLDMHSLKRLVRSHFRVFRTTTVLPLGNGGILRLLNSHKLNSLLGFVFSQRYLDALKERAGFGYTLIVLAQKRM